MRFASLLFLFLAVSSVALQAQRRVDPTQLYERVFAILPMTGKGTLADPKRPAGLPLPGAMKANDRTGVVAYNVQLSDDGNLALVELVFASKTTALPAMAQLRAATASPDVQIFDNPGLQRAEIQRAFGAKKKGLDLTKFQVVVP